MVHLKKHRNEAATFLFLSNAQSVCSRRFHNFESLEARHLLAADLIAHWTADDLNATIDNGARVPPGPMKLAE